MNQPTTDEQLVELAESSNWALLASVSPEQFREAWVTRSKLRDLAVDELRRGIYEFWDINTYGLAPLLAGALTNQDIYELFLILREGRTRLEIEWRPSFEKYFGHLCELPEPESWASSTKYREQLAEYVVGELESEIFHTGTTSLGRKLSQELTPKELVELYQLAANRTTDFNENWPSWYEIVFPQVRGLLPHIEVLPPELRQRPITDSAF